MINRRNKNLDLPLYVSNVSDKEELFEIETKWFSCRTVQKRLVISFSLLWFINLLVFEFIIFRLMIFNCDFAETSPGDVRLVLVADPQLTDKYSYRHIQSWPWVPLVQFYSDIYMRKNYQILQTIHKPDAVSFLGDLFDSAKVLDDEDFEEELERFHWIFEKQNSAMQVFYLSGNHDIGYRIANTGELAQRFIQHFGPLNYKVKLGSFEFVFISSLTLELNRAPLPLYLETKNFLESLPAEPSGHRVVMSHVPFWRPRNSGCGPLNPNGNIEDRTGYSYRNLLPPNVTASLLASLNPSYIFSGDDHRPCFFPS